MLSLYPFHYCGHLHLPHCSLCYHTFHTVITKSVSFYHFVHVSGIGEDYMEGDTNDGVECVGGVEDDGGTIVM